jgi:hypothetical protein
MSRICLATLGTLLVGCLSHPAVPPAPPGVPTAGRFPVEITLEHVAGADAWRVSYHFLEPVRRVRFKQADYPFRIAQWHVEGSNVRLARDERGDEVLAVRGPIREFSLSIPGYTRRPEKAGPLLLAFADGSRLIYTDYFTVEPADGAARAVQTVFTFVPRADERVIVLDQVSAGPTRWQSAGDGTEVYFGRTAPIVTAGLTLVVDAGAPSWLLERTQDLLPRLFALYARRTGQPLDFKPVVFLNYGDEPGAGSRSLGGSTLTGMVQLEVRLGSNFRQAVDDSTMQDVLFLLAHEAAHFWNGQMFHNDADARGGDWMHEGGADAFALRALIELGAMTPAQYLERLSQALSGCMLGLGDAGIRDSSTAGRTKTYYNCGNTIALLSEAAGRRKHATSDIFTFWGHLLGHSRGRHYDEATYLDTLRTEGGADLIPLLESMLGGPGAGSALVPALNALGIKTVADEGAGTRDYQQLAGKLACLGVLDGACGPGAMANESGNRCTVEAGRSCAALAAGTAIGALGAHPLFREGPAAYDYLVRQCSAGAAVAVTAKPPTADLKCAHPPAARPPFTRIESLPWPIR